VAEIDDRIRELADKCWNDARGQRDRMAAQQVGQALQPPVVDISAGGRSTGSMAWNGKEVNPKNRCRWCCINPQIETGARKRNRFRGVASFSRNSAEIRTGGMGESAAKADGRTVEIEATGLLATRAAARDASSHGYPFHRPK